MKGAFGRWFRGLSFIRWFLASRIGRWLGDVYRKDAREKPAEPADPGAPLLTMKIPRLRTSIAMAAIVVLYIVLGGRVLYLQYLQTDFLQQKGEARYARTIPIAGMRGEIRDRNGVVLASSQPTRDIWADPEFVKKNLDKDALKSLAKVLHMPYKELMEKLRNPPSRNYVYLARNQDVGTAEQVHALGIAGVGVTSGMQRQYPDGEVMAHIVGVVGRNGRGQEGVELAKESELAPEAGARRVIRDRYHRNVDDIWVKDARSGSNVTLAIDSRVQFVAHRAIKDMVESTGAIAGAVVVIDVKTGEVVALANVPSYDPNDRSTMNFARMRNRVLTDQFEPGSTMKPFAIAKAVDMGLVDPLTTIQTSPGKLTIGDRTIGDTHDYGLITVAEVLSKSSNIGTTKIALEIPPETLYQTYLDLGFGRQPKIEFPGSTRGRLRPGKTWRPIEQATISYGYGVTVSLLQLARAYTALALEGGVVDLTLFKREGPAPVERQVFKPETARKVRAMMMDTVKRGGTATRVKVAGYTVAGKTGTAHKVKNGKYSRDVVASFVGIVPATDPRFVVAVMVDEPRKGRYGGTVAGPAFNTVAQAALRTFQVPADDSDEQSQKTRGLLAEAKKRYEDARK